MSLLSVDEELEPEIEAACVAIYGKSWNGPPEKMPGEEMKEVWRNIARKCRDAIDECRNKK